MTTATTTPNAFSPLEESFKAQLVGKGVPAKVAHDAAIDMAKGYGVPQSPAIAEAAEWLITLMQADIEGDHLAADLDRLAAENDN